MNMDVDENDKLAFAAFYRNLACKENIIFMYFSTGLLHFAVESCALVPKSGNLVLITTCLSEEEEKVVEEKIRRPHINFLNYYHDGDIWNLIVSEVTGNFGWLDVDCFIFNQNIFEEMTHFGEKIGINTLWVKSYACYCLENLFSNTYLQFFRYDVLKQVQAKFDQVSMLPIVFSNTYDDIPYERYYKIPKGEQEKLFLMYPALRNDKKGLDTTHYYQLLMFTEGYTINRVRELSQMKQYYSEEAVHLGGCHMIHVTKLDNSLKRIYYRFNMRFSYYVLLKHLAILPKQYEELREIFENNMRDNKLSCDREDLESHILEYAKRNGLEKVVRDYLTI